MAVVRIPEHLWEAACAHLFNETGEHFAFFLARWTHSQGKPVFLVRDILLIPDSQLSYNRNGMVMSTDSILWVVNTAVETGYCLIEAHNHGGTLPRFSRTDYDEMPGFVEYIHSSLPDRPYAATVWGDSSVYGEYFISNGHKGTIRSIIAHGKQFRQIVSHEDDIMSISTTFDRQLPWFTEEGQRQLSRLRVGIAGCGGTGAHVIQQLSYLGCRDIVLIDDDKVDATNMNRLVTATPADIDTPKVILGRRLAKGICPDTCVMALDIQIQSLKAIDALKGVDVIFGCVDNDGARLMLNEIALAYMIPYFDLAVGIDAHDGKVANAGGRVAVVQPDGPCLYCMGEIDPEEASYYLASPAERIDREMRGYVTGMDVKAPSVVSLNGLITSMAINEFIAFFSGIRPVIPLTSYDLIGTGRAEKGQWLGPLAFKPKPLCIQCSLAGVGDDSDVHRYARLDTHMTKTNLNTGSKIAHCA
jgi:molybdopterin/thiamine biosynthesis adenylyltransferase